MSATSEAPHADIQKPRPDGALANKVEVLITCVPACRKTQDCAVSRGTVVVAFVSNEVRRVICAICETGREGRGGGRGEEGEEDGEGGARISKLYGTMSSYSLTPF